MGHIILEAGVATDPNKIAAMVSWPIPQFVKELKEFFGINRLLQDGSIAKLLTDLLKKDGFKWGKRPQQAFEILRSAMSKAPVLPLPDFSHY